MRKLFLLLPFLLAACHQQADVVSANISRDADNFLVTRRIVFVNGWTDKQLLVIEGRCSLGNSDPARELSVTCMTGPNEYKKHFLGLSDNVTYVVEQIESNRESPYHYSVTFAPSQIVPNVEVN